MKLILRYVTLCCKYKSELKLGLAALAHFVFFSTLNYCALLKVKKVKHGDIALNGKPIS